MPAHLASYKNRNIEEQKRVITVYHGKWIYSACGVYPNSNLVRGSAWLQPTPTVNSPHSFHLGLLLSLEQSQVQITQQNPDHIINCSSRHHARRDPTTCRKPCLGQSQRHLRKSMTVNHPYPTQVDIISRLRSLSRRNVNTAHRIRDSPRY